MQEIEREKKRLAKVERRKIEDEQKIVLDAVLEKQLDAGTVAVNTEYEQFIVRFFLCVCYGVCSTNSCISMSLVHPC